MTCVYNNNPAVSKPPLLLPYSKGETPRAGPAAMDDVGEAERIQKFLKDLFEVAEAARKVGLRTRRLIGRHCMTECV